MAGNDEDLVSQIKITGGQESAAQIESFAQTGADAFDKLATSAAGAAAVVSGSADKIGASGVKAAEGVAAISNLGSRGKQTASNIKDIENAISSLTSKLPQLTQAVGRFTQRLALVGAAGVAAGIGLAKAAENIVKAVDGESNALKKATEAQIDANNSQLNAEVAAINHASSIRQLDNQLQTGRITYTQYAQAVNNLNADYKEQTRVAAEVELAQKRVKEENDALNKSLADRTAMNALIQKFGGPLTQSLISFGRQVQSLHQQFITAFSPALGGLIDLISNTLTKNSVAVSKFFDVAAGKLADLVKNNGPQLQLFFENLGSAASKVFIGIIDAAPGVLDFFNNKLAPAVTKVVAGFDSLATGINKVFGTNLTGGSLILITILAQMTGSIRVLFTVLRAGGAIFKGTISLIEKIAVTIAQAFGAKNVAQIAKIGAAVSKGGGPVKTFLALIRTAIPLVTVLAETVATILGVSFGSAAILVAALTAALIFLLTKIDWKAFAANAVAAIGKIIAFFGQLLQGAKNIVNGIVTGFQNLIAFFVALPSQIGQGFSSLWDLILAGAAATVVAFESAWNAVVAFFSNIGQGIAAGFVSLWAAIVAAASVAVAAVSAVWNTIVATFTTIGQGISTAVQTAVSAVAGFFQNAWDAVVSGFNSLVSKISSLFDSLVAAARAKLGPILDLALRVASAVANATSSAAASNDASQGLAGGGPVRGPGTSTSDSIPIWASAGEFMIRARAAAKYGMGFLNAVNNGTFKMPRFALGGAISMIAPGPRSHYATGGEVVGGSGLTPLNLSIFGEDFKGLLMPEDTAGRLTKFAIARQSRSAGRKPGWIGGSN